MFNFLNLYNKFHSVSFIIYILSLYIYDNFILDTSVYKTKPRFK